MARLSSKIKDFFILALLNSTKIKNLQHFDSTDSKKIHEIATFGRLEYFVLEAAKSNKDILTEKYFNQLRLVSKKRDEISLKNFIFGSKLKKAFDHKKINFTFLKGMFLNNAYPNNLSCRPMTDIDILVSQENLKKSVEILNELGFYNDFSSQSVYDQVLETKYFLPVFHNSSGVIIDLHFRATMPNDFKECPLTNLLLNDKNHEAELHILYLIYSSAIKDSLSGGPMIFRDLKLIVENEDIDFKFLETVAKNMKIKKILFAYLRCLNEFFEVDNLKIKNLDSHNNNEDFLLLNFFNKSDGLASRTIREGFITSFFNALNKDSIAHHQKVKSSTIGITQSLGRLCYLINKYSLTFLRSLFDYQKIRDQYAVHKALVKLKDD